MLYILILKTLYKKLLLTSYYYPRVHVMINASELLSMMRTTVICKENGSYYTFLLEIVVHNTHIIISKIAD